jgi:hypothetical protein
MKSWATLLQQETQKQVREPEGKGWLTAKQIIESVGCGRTKGHRLIKESLRSGNCEVFNGTQETRDGRFSPQVWYRLK